jgi:sialidase-1
MSLAVLFAAALIATEQDHPRIPVLMQGITDVKGIEDAPGGYGQYREQNIVVTKAGRVVVIAQGRDPSKWSDRSGQDLVVRFSDDSGLTWSDALLAVEHGDLSVCPNGAVYDSETDTIHVLYSLFLWDFHLDRAGPKSVGDGPECKQFQISSSDGGETWTKPRDITASFPSNKGGVVVFGSGEGIQLKVGPHAGRLVMPGGIQDDWGNRMFYSDDHGKTWKVGLKAPDGKVKDKNVRLECKVAELPSGRLILNARCTPIRARAFSDDGGETWTVVELDEGLEAVSCNGSIIAFTDSESGKDVVLCSYPSGPGRTHGVVAVSDDGGMTWPVKQMVIPEEFAYSSLMMLPDGKIGLFYEARGHKDIVLVRLSPAELLKGKL